MDKYLAIGSAPGSARLPEPPGDLAADVEFSTEARIFCLWAVDTYDDIKGPEALPEPRVP